ncbi:serine/threonine-protein kinase [Nocardioides sp.]|uniref:serine/threonine-protein kinase n=1 Tax=Nocardioides sp. TaxID=35761 RepID=UPI003564A2C3
MIADRYTLDREIGRGGMGAVWLGRDRVLGREVALKRIGMMPGVGTPDLERAEREARLAARLNHPHVVAVFDLVTEGDHQWLVMEYVEGVTLAQLVKRDGALTPDQASPLIRQVSDALAAAHAVGIVHRDVKPSNILVNPRGEAKLSDFGIARASADATLTQTGLVTGSPAYLAPEVASGAMARDASDVWSVGATLFHALAGRPPYDVGDNLMGALYRIVHEEPPRLTNAGWLTPLLEATMTLRPEDRWSMAQVRDFLAAGPTGTVLHPAPATVRETGAGRTQVLDAQPPNSRRTLPPAPEPTPSAPARRPRRTPGGALVIGGLAALALVALVLWGLVSLSTGDDEPADRSPGGSASTPAKAPVTEKDLTDFVDDYLSTVTRDPETAFAMLTPSFQAQSNGLSGYTGFWSTVRSAELVNASADPTTLVVRYTVEYTKQDGARVRDDVTLQLVRRNGTFLIDGEAG